ncbi:AraC family transcriptional regulator [Chryseobacterium piperi]|uniref:AraC family transcriptional regulator n=1 Tax=Chryseobacterium piperi TaxID=558152 RepID=A0A086AEA4_9FLAO|nr:helix-turn-helix domain-containing protein [Chryseobacterium piperi]ASW75248.1 AraC family transcriptional regulator [Chryseobacterium piperi]KFF15018.1 AraC family transcriptional regulator [Chryseobacterium piperi]
MESFMIEHQEFESPEELSDTIKCFWYNIRRSDSKEELSGFEVVPDGYAEIIFYFGSDCSISCDGNMQVLPSPFMIGLLNHPVLFYMKDRLDIIGIRCFPWAVFDLLGLPSNKKGVRIVEHPIVELQSILNTFVQEGKIEEALTCIKEYFLNARSQVAIDTMLYKAGAAMREAGGTVPVSRIADAAHATIRTLERKFKHSSGYSVKDVSGLMRFERVRNQLWLYPDSNIASLAYDLGYTDQSHLSKEFKRYSGTSPAAFARKAMKRKESINQDFITFIQNRK